MTRQEHILEVARELFGTQGFEATSIRQIAERCGLTDAAVLYHFGSKEGILSSLWLHGAAAERARPVPLAPSLPGQVDKIVSAVLMDAALYDAETRLMVRQTLAGDERAAQMRSQAVGRWLTSFESLFARECPPETAALMADALFMVLVGIVLRGQVEHGPAFAEICQRPEFQEQARRLAHVAVGRAWQQAG